MPKPVERLTQAEIAILDASKRLPASDAKHAAYAQLRQNGLPTRRVEAWHYTDLRSAMKHFPGFPQTHPKPVETKPRVDQFIPAVRIAFVDGKCAGFAALPAGVCVAGTGLPHVLRNESDAIGMLNALTGLQGVVLEIAGGVQAGAIELCHEITGESAVALRHAISVGTGASAVLIERHAGTDGIASHSNTITALDVGDDARLVWLIAQEEGGDAIHLSQLNVTLGARTNLTILVLNAGGGLVRREINIAAKGEGSEISIRGVNLIGGKSHVDVTTALVHEAPGATANEIFRNVVTDEGRGVFQGQIKVAQAAQKTDAKMACNTLLLSDSAEFFAKPELEIFADDVACGHGATVTDIVDEHLFYLRARGIPQKPARAMLVQAFVEEVFDDLEDEAMKDALNLRIEAWLVRHG